MYTFRDKGWSLIEILIVVAIMGILAVIGLATFLSARLGAKDANARIYATDVYKVALAHVASDSANVTVLDEDCTDGYEAGQYNVNGGGTVRSCTVQENLDGLPEVHVISVTGEEYTVP